MLTKDQKKYLRTLAHNRDTIIWTGQQGITANLLAEINAALDHHELIKIKIRAGDRKARAQVAADIGAQTGAEAVQKVGNVVVLYRRNKQEPKIVLPQ